MLSTIMVTNRQCRRLFLPVVEGFAATRPVLTRLVFAALMVVLLVSAHGRPAQAQITASLDLVTSTGQTTYESGEAFEYVFSFACFGATCQNAVLTTTLPTNIEFVGLPPNSLIDVANSTLPTIGSTGGGITLVFDNIDGVEKGLTAGTTGVVKVIARYAPGTTPGTPTSLPSTIDADNADPVTPPTVDLINSGAYSASASKSPPPNTVVGFPMEFTIELCVPAKGGINLGGVSFLDTLPADARFVSAEGTYNYTPAVSPDIGGTVQFTGLPDVPAGTCLTRTVTLTYDTLPADPAKANTVDVTATPAGCAGNPDPLPEYCGTDPDDVERTENAVGNFTVTVPTPTTGGGKTSTSPSSFSGTEALAGEQVTYTVAASNDGFVDLNSVVITDAIPANVTVTGFQAVPGPSSAVTVSYQLDNNPTWNIFGTYSTLTEITSVVARQHWRRYRSSLGDRYIGCRRAGYRRVVERGRQN